jgi:hypothetical protein
MVKRYGALMRKTINFPDPLSYFSHAENAWLPEHQFRRHIGDAEIRESRRKGQDQAILFEAIA